MRVAPVGLFWWTFKEGSNLGKVFDCGVMCAGLTHGHPTGYLSGGVLAALVFSILDGAPLGDSLKEVSSLLVRHPGHEEVLDALNRAQRLTTSGLSHSRAIEMLGEGWVAEEALAIAVYCALVAESFEQGVVLAVNHAGDSDSTGAIAGSLLGLVHGIQAIPERWLEALELRTVIEEVASDLWSCRNWSSFMDDSRLWERYPGY